MLEEPVITPTESVHSFEPISIKEEKTEEMFDDQPEDFSLEDGTMGTQEDEEKYALAIKEEQKENVMQMVSVPISVFQSIFLFTARPVISKAMVQKPAKLPISVRFLMHPEVHRMIFATTKKRSLEDEGEITSCFGGKLTKMWRCGSYAIVQAPLIVEHKDNKTALQLNYVTYNSNHERIWPFVVQSKTK